MNHFFQLLDLGPADDEMLEGWTALAFADGRTSRIRLGTLVSGVTYRHPGLLVKTATTLDVLSQGRSLHARHLHVLLHGPRAQYDR
jgi:alkanesulfonate monooxygenase SsuD/methylene tetrahydromethanopterin reductase-like flavin-dependent oxidoreductase (luciferase family)